MAQIGMKNYIQFFHESTGYNHAKRDFSGPKTNIPMCGSDGVQYYDGRKGILRLIEETKLPKGATGFLVYRNNKIQTGFFENDLEVKP